MRVFSFVLLCIVCLSCCQHGPDDDALEDEIQAKLNSEFEDGLFEIKSLVRRGHYPFDGADDTANVLVYFDAELELRRDHKLSSWDELSVGSLITVLGATPQGVEGVKAAGNKQGDILFVHGTIAFAQAGDSWKRSTYAGAKARKSEPAPNDIRELPYRQQLEKISDLGKRLQSKNDDIGVALLTSALESVREKAQRRLHLSSGVLTLATGTEAGQYHRQGSELAAILSEQELETLAISSQGSRENCELLQAREVMFAYVQNDIANMAYTGTGLFKQQLPMKNLRSLCTLYPEAVHVLTLKKSGITSIADLRGKRVDVGPNGSGSRINAIEILEAADIPLAKLRGVQGKTPSEALDDLRAGDVDAVVLTSAFPAPQVLKLAQQKALSLVSIDDAITTKLTERHPFLVSLELPEKTYPGMDAEASTIGVTATLATHKAVEGARVGALLKTLYSNVERLSQGSPQAFFISPDTARTGLSIPLHPAAEKHLTKAGR